jgi:hypothetical protein
MYLVAGFQGGSGKICGGGCSFGRFGFGLKVR